MSWAGHVAGMRKLRNAYKIVFDKSDRERPLGMDKEQYLNGY
jgi:hypothetical protein